MITSDELAAIAAALAALGAEGCQPEMLLSRWKLAARNPDLEIEDVRALR